MKGKSRKKGKLAERGVSLSGSVYSPDSCLIHPNCPAAKILFSAAALFALCVILTTVNLLSSQAEEQRAVLTINTIPASKFRMETAYGVLQKHTALIPAKVPPNMSVT